MSQQPTTPEEDRERTADEEIIDRIRRRRYWIKELKWPLILGLLMALAMLAALGHYVFNSILDLRSNPMTSQVGIQASFMMGWFFCVGFSLIGVIAASILMDNRIQRLLLKYYDLTIELEHRLELQQRTTDKHTT
jgi:hypothetical protein